MSEGVRQRPKPASGAANPNSGDNNAQKARQGMQITTEPANVALSDLFWGAQLLCIFL